MVTKIISGGQTGADRAALDFAIKYKIPHGGWLPKGRKAENGQLPKKYHLRELLTGGYRKRTKQNVIDSDGTLIVSHGNLTGGSALTREFAITHKKPRLHIDLEYLPLRIAAENIITWIKRNKIRVLNVAGAKESKDEHIYQVTIDLLEMVYMSEKILFHADE